MGETGMVNFHGRFVWYELMTTDVEAARAFYTDIMGWRTHDASMPSMAYTLFTVGEASVSGLMSLPEGAAKAGAKPRWLGYVGVNDVDAMAERIKHLGGVVYVPPTDIPSIGRFSVVADPQSATLALVKGLHPGNVQPTLTEPGCVGWHELLAADSGKAFAFYRALFDWQNANAEIGPTKTYQLFSAGGQTIGGIFTKPPTVPVPFWLYYFNTSDIDTTVERVKAAGGAILEGPVEVLGGGRVARCTDPQGAMFALTGKRSDKAIGYFELTASHNPPRARS
jgi:uncharacterized protein